MIATIDNIEVRVQARFMKGCRGSRDSFGVPLEPDEPDHFEIDSVTLNGLEIIGALDEETLRQIQEQLFDERQDAYCD